MSLFGCCQTYQVDQSDGTALYSISRGRNSKNNSLNLLNSPKASLKSLTSLKSFKNS